MDADLFMNLLTWFIKESSHRGYSDINPSDECPNPAIVLQEDDSINNSDKFVDSNLECKIQGKTYYFKLRIQHKIIQYLTTQRILFRLSSTQLLQLC